MPHRSVSATTGMSTGADQRRHFALGPMVLIGLVLTVIFKRIGWLSVAADPSIAR